MTTQQPRPAGRDGLPLSRRGFLGLTAVTVAAVSGCASTSVASRIAERHRDGVLRIGVASAPSNINPLDSGSEVTRWISEPVVETLYAYDDKHRSVPLLASGEPEVSADGLTWRIPLRSGITFQNGDELTANDVVATLAHVNDLSSGSEWITYLLGYVQSYRAEDAYTVRIDLTKPYGLMRSHLTNLPIVHRDYAKRKDAMMGTGPFRLESFTPGQTFKMVAYDGYHGGPPELKGIEYTVFQDGATRLISLRQGKVDLITSVPYHNIGSVRSNPDLHLDEVEGPNDILCYVAVMREPFSDPWFRKAVAAATDRLGVQSKVFGGAAVIGQGPVGPAELGWDPDLQPYAAEPDLDRAQELLAQATTERRDFTLTIGVNQTSRDMAQVLAAGWAKIGIDVTIQQLPGGAWSNKMLDRSYDMLMNVFQSGFTSGPANYMALAPAQSTSVLSCGFVNAEVDRLMDTVWRTSDDEEREASMRRINEILVEEAVMFPPVYPKIVVARLATVSPLNRHQLRISRVAPQTLSLSTGGTDE